MLRRLITFIALSCLAPQLAPAQDNRAQTGAIQSHFDQTQEVASFDIPVGPWSNGALPTEHFKGERRDQVLFYGQSLATPQQILAPLEQSLLEDGYQSRLECTDRLCGGYEFQKSIDALGATDRPIALFDFAAQSFTKSDEAVFLLASRAPNGLFLYRVDLAPQGQTSHTGQPSPSAPLSTPDQSDPTSWIVLDGLVFGVGQKSLEIQDANAINQLVEQLTRDPNVRVMLVGHSDNRGALDTNIALSRQRADQVRQVLIDTYNIAPERIDAAGVGFLAPRASNHTVEGRLKNRRVEAVFLPK